jgi:hypothetical protein
MEFIRQYLLSRNITISDEDWYPYAEKNTLKEYKKKDIILKTGETDNYLSFVE